METFLIGEKGKVIETAPTTMITKLQSQYEIPSQHQRLSSSSASIRKSSHSDPSTIAIPNIWHKQMGHISLLRLYKLGKEYLGVHF